jgi:hypothetical protein
MQHRQYKLIAITTLIIALLFISQISLAQNISLDHPIKCGKLQCFPSANNDNTYYYLPANPHVALTDEKKPKFSFTRYVQNRKSGDDQNTGGIVEADGGGIIHFLVDYSVSAKQMKAAEADLKDINQDAILSGPIIFEAGNFALVSSVAKDEDKPNELSKKIVGVGRAPLIEGLQAAVSIHLTKQGAQILWHSFQMDTPDVSLVFEMTFSGLNDPAEATITADWTKLQDQADVTMGAKVSYLGIGGGFDYSNFWQNAKDTGAIKIEYKGNPDKLQSIIDRAYNRLHELMFEPIPAAQASTADGDPMETMLAVTNAASRLNGKSYSAPWEVKINGGYKRRKIKRKGTYTFDFKQRSKSTLTTAMAGNIGNLYKKYGNDPAIFNTINLSSKEHRIREISVVLDAKDEEQFSKYINHVTLSMKKQHGSGQTSVGEITFNRLNFQSGSLRKLNYGWDGEVELEDWLKYKYKADWSFIGGAQQSSGWLETDSTAIALSPPYQYREVEFITSPDILAEADVRLVTIRVKHDFFGHQVKETINLLPSRNQFSAQRIFAVPPSSDLIEYVITWTLNSRKKITSGILSSNETIIFCDELPPSQ